MKDEKIRVSWLRAVSILALVALVFLLGWPKEIEAAQKKTYTYVAFLYTQDYRGVKSVDILDDEKSSNLRKILKDRKSDLKKEYKKLKSEYSASLKTYQERIKKINKERDANNKKNNEADRLRKEQEDRDKANGKPQATFAIMRWAGSRGSGGGARSSNEPVAPIIPNEPKAKSSSSYRVPSEDLTKILDKLRSIQTKEDLPKKDKYMSIYKDYFRILEYSKR